MTFTLMILCHCAAISDSTVRRLIDEGARSLADVARGCGAGRRCAPCRDEILSLLCAAPAAVQDRAGTTALSEPQRSAA